MSLENEDGSPHIKRAWWHAHTVPELRGLRQPMPEPIKEAPISGRDPVAKNKEMAPEELMTHPR